MPKPNADYWAKPKGLSIFMRSQNLWDLALELKKEKTKPKDFAMCVAKSKP
jgi:hypothetical protein